MQISHFHGKETSEKRKTLATAFISWTVVVAYSCTNLNFRALGYTGQTTILSLRYYYDNKLYNL